jgi:single-strand DNA-binding protein
VNINTCTISGNLTRDAELKYTQGGTPVLSFSIASGRSVKKGDQWEELAQFFDIQKMGSGVDKIAALLTKGRNVTIEGRLRQDRWEQQDGQKRSKVYLWAEVINLGREPRPAGHDAGSGAAKWASDEAEMDRRDSEGFADDIPF